MKKLSDAELNKILREKLYSYEAEPLDGIEQDLFGAIGKNRVRQARKANVVYLTVGSLLLMSILLYYWTDSVETTILPAPQYKSDIRRHDSKAGLGAPIEAKQNLSISSSPSELKNNINIEDLGTIPIDTAKTITNQGIEVVKEKDSNRDFTAPRSKNEPNAPDSVISAADEMQRNRSEGKTWISFGIQPFFNYKSVHPIEGDGIGLSRFDGPPNLSSQRFGFRLSSSVDHQFSSKVILGLGLSYFQFRETFQYESNEQTQEIEPFNSIDELIQGASISISGRYSLVRHSKGKQYLTMTVDGQRHFTYRRGSNKFQAMLGFGFAQEWIINGRVIRVTPTLSYSLTQYKYPGVQVRPFLLGVEMALSLRLSK